MRLAALILLTLSACQPGPEPVADSGAIACMDANPSAESATIVVQGHQVENPTEDEWALKLRAVDTVSVEFCAHGDTSEPIVFEVNGIRAEGAPDPCSEILLVSLGDELDLVATQNPGPVDFWITIQ